MRKYLEDKCFQYLDDLGTAAHSFGKLLTNLRSIFECIRESWLKLTINKCEFPLSDIQFLGSSITTEGMSENRERVEKFLNSLKMPKTPKQICQFIGSFQYFRAFLPKLSDRLLPFYSFKEQPRNEVHTRTSQCKRNFQKGLSEGMWFCSSLTKTSRSVCNHGWCQLLCCRLCPSDRKLY